MYDHYTFSTILYDYVRPVRSCTTMYDRPVYASVLPVQPCATMYTTNTIMWDHVQPVRPCAASTCTPMCMRPYTCITCTTLHVRPCMYDQCTRVRPYTASTTVCAHWRPCSRLWVTTVTTSNLTMMNGVNHNKQHLSWSKISFFYPFYSHVRSHDEILHAFLFPLT